MTAPLAISNDTPALLDEVMKRSGQNLLACYQCRRCAAGCPVGDDTGVTPDRLIRLITLGDAEAALANKLVWRCVACYTCGTRCPNNIQTARINEVLKQMVKEKHGEALFPKIANFHLAFIEAARTMGRVNEIEFMGRYEIKNSIQDVMKGDVKALFDEFLAQAQLGLKMMKLHRMHFGVDRIEGRGEVKKLFKRAAARKAGE